MSDHAEFQADELKKFVECSVKLMTVSYKDDDSTRTNLNLLLDELNSLEYSIQFLGNEDVNKIVGRLSSLVPFHQELFITKICHLLVNIVARQQLTLTDHNLHVSVEFVVRALESCHSWTVADSLQALSALLYETGGRLTKFHETLLGDETGVLCQLARQYLETDQEDGLRGAVQCIEHLCMRSPGNPYLEEKYLAVCYDIFIKVLHTPATDKSDEVVYCKTVISAIRGIQNILLSTKGVPAQHLGPILAALRSFMLHGLLTQRTVVPPSLYPTPLPQSNPLPKTEPAQTKEDSTQEGRKPRKKRQNKKGKGRAGVAQEEAVEVAPSGGSYQEVKVVGGAQGASSDSAVCPDTLREGLQGDSARPAWSLISTSESEYSDTEGGQLAKTRSLYTRLRQWAYGCLHAVIKSTDKKLLFGYWSSFLPESPSSGNVGQSLTLITSVLKDPSPKCRMGALSAITALLDGTKPFLAAAEDSQQTSAAFTPYSVVLGSMVKEVHRCLLLALVAENFPLTITQLIKCIATLVNNVPYHRLKPGLISRVIKQIRHFIHHRDPNIRVACLTCLGSMSALQPPMLEVCHIIQPSNPPVTGCPHPSTEQGASAVNSAENVRELDSGFQSSESSGIENGAVSLSCSEPSKTSRDLSGETTPVHLSGTLTPVFSEQSLQARCEETSWVIKLCIKNILPQPSRSSQAEVDSTPHLDPLPVRLESLQVLANLCKGYFPIIRNSLPLLKDLVHKCLDDPEPTVRLHASKLLNELGKAILTDIQSAEKENTQSLKLHQVVEFWMGLFNGPLPVLLQCPYHHAVRAALCDCLADLGPEVFESLPLDKRMLCVTLALGLVCEEDGHLRAAAVRTLGIYSLYPLLCEDVSFIADSANAILTCMEDTSLNVRAKAAWAMGNLTDALVLNRSLRQEFVDDFSDMLLLKLMTTAAKATADNDKVRASAVRSVGNLLHYMPSRSLAKSTFTTAVADGVKAVIKNIGSGTAKVRWNACYAVSNMFKNALLPHGQAEWTDDLFGALCSVVKDCKNFKVRINAALALGTPTQREHYGSGEQFLSVWRSLLAALATADNITNFTEYRYLDNLNDQICTSVVHMASLVIQSDLVIISPVLMERLEQFLPYLDKWKTATRTNIDTTTKDTVRRNLESCLTLLSSLTLTEAENNGLQQLNTFNALLKYETEGGEKKPEKSAFVQTYD